MSVLEILKVIAALATAATGVFVLFAPRKTVGFTGLEPIGGRGISELRAVLGGLFIALGVTPLWLGETAYLMLGIGYLAIAGVRAVSIVVDRSAVPSNLISLATEIVLGIILVV
jgi:hypothetical protein